MDILQTIANELTVQPWQVEAAVKLLDDGATVPFIARYRKEVTGSLTDDHLRELEERLYYLRELQERKLTVLKSIESQGKLSDELKKSIEEADNKARVEDLYLPFKPKRRTKAQVAREAGLEPLADELLADPQLVPETHAALYLNPEAKIDTAADALEGAKQILVERFAEDADLLEKLRTLVWNHAELVSQVAPDQETKGAKFSDYFDYKEPLRQVPSHRALAVLRGRKEEILRVSIEVGEQEAAQGMQEIRQTFGIEHKQRPADDWLNTAVEWAWKIKIKLKIDMDLMIRLKETSDEVAIHVFKDNLKNLLMSAPAGNHVVMGLDPGLRTGVKVVVVDGTGKLLHFSTIFPHVPQKQWDASKQHISQLCQEHQVKLISIGNGTASRETDAFAKEVIQSLPDSGITKIMVSEAGASVYSASSLAAKEFPDLDVSYRGAVSIARRLQDPLAELVKIDPKSIGVGQYQHDVNQVKLERSLTYVVEDCVNSVGADVNTASLPLLKSISGLNESVAQNIILYREEHGRFDNRDELKKVPRLGDKTFEQAVGFLRILEGKNRLDASSVHPEAYPFVEQLCQKLGVELNQLIGNSTLIDGLNPQEYVDDQYGLPTVQDILIELKKPGRDPRPEFKMANFNDAIHSLSDLKPDLVLEGVVTNVTNFGAFVDIGVHQDGLVHISQMAGHFVKDPHEVLKVGDILKVKVLDVDVPRKRIQLTMRLTDKNNQAQMDLKGSAMPSKQKPKQKKQQAPKNTFFGDALEKALSTNR